MIFLQRTFTPSVRAYSGREKLEKGEILLKLVISLVTLLLSSLAFSNCYEIEVIINETKANGSSWDFFDGQPDVRVCFYDEWGIRCKGKGKGKDYSKPYCKNSFNCNLGVVRFISEKTKIEITDVDRMRKDNAVDFGECLVGRECILGNATVKFTKSACE